ncbi:MAG: hypothetical protein HYW63_00310 [Candidatus Levybacteria bacterium]|nr:hypothetical protein [Candidatus Levybacteria bacterium]
MEENNELKEFIQETLRQINEGKGNNSIDRGIVRFEIAVIKRTTKEGKISVGVMGIGGAGKGEASDEKTSKIFFEIYVNQGSPGKIVAQDNKDWSFDS